MHSNTCFSRKLWTVLGLLPLLTATGIQAQGTVGETNIRTYTIGGTIGIQGHGYTTTRDFNRRAPLGAMTTVNLNYTLLGFQSGLNIRYSTDDNQFRQSMNEISFSGSWRWISLTAGDVSPSHARYGLSGTSFRGGRMELTPGAVTFDLAAGRVNRAIRGNRPQDLREPAYERWIYAGKIGFGNPGSSYFNLSTLYGKDSAGSVDFLDETDETSPVTRPRPTPAENLALTPDFQISLFQQAFKIGAQTTFSAYTRDTGSKPLDMDEIGIPSFLTGIYNPRSSSRISFAGTATTELDINPFQLRVGYERIQPGFETMGLRQVRDDNQTWNIQPRVSFLNQKIALDGSYRFGNDNLLSNRVITQNRQDISVNARSMISSSFSLGLGYSNFLNKTETSGTNEGLAEGGQQQSSQVFQIMPTYTLMGTTTSHSFSLAGIYQTLDARFPSAYGAGSSTSSTINTMLNHTVSFQSGFSVNSGINYMKGEASGADFDAWGINAGTGYAFFERKLNVSANFSISQNSFSRPAGEQIFTNKSRQLNANMNASYRLTPTNNLRFNLRTLNNSLLEGAGQSFSELEARIQIDHRF
ncbi:MAG: hypothetical protein ABR545_07565 [Cyclonatronaceae bacterium]